MSRGRKATAAGGIARGRREEGSATVLLLAGMLAAGAVCALWVSGARAGFARQRAETAADLAALAAARAHAPGTALASGTTAAQPCRAAADVAARNGGQLVSCAFAGEDVLVTVRVDGPVSATVTAKAGPVQ